jgi:hypothetical protein
MRGTEMKVVCFGKPMHQSIQENQYHFLGTTDQLITLKRLHANPQNGFEGLA